MSSRKSKDKPHSSRSTHNDNSKLIEVDPTPHAPPTERRETTRGPPTTRGQDDRQTLRRGESDDYYNPAVTLGPSAGPSYVQSPTHYNGGGGQEGGPPAPAQQYPAHMGGGPYGGPSQQQGGQHNGGSGGSGSHGHGGYTGGGPIYHAGYGEPMKPAHYSSHVAAGAMSRPSGAEQHQGYYQSGSGGYGGGGGGGGAPQQESGGGYGAPPQLQHSQTYGAPPPSNQFPNSGYTHPQQTQGAKPPRRDSTSSSSSSSYVDISRAYPIPPVKKNPLGALRTFFSAPSESRRRVVRRKSSRTLRAQRREGKKISGRRSSSSEGSSVDSDLAYGTGYLRRRKSKRRGSRGSRSPRRYGQGQSRSPRRYGSPGRDGLNWRDGRNRENLRPAGGVSLPGLHHSSTMPGSFPIEAGVVAAGSAAIVAGLSHHSSSSSKPPKPSKQSKKDAEKEILKLGEDLHKLAKQQNRYDLEEAAKRGKYNMVRDDHRLGRHGYGPKSLSGGASPTRGIAPSRPAKGAKKPKDDDGWETSDSDDTSSSESVDDALGYGGENTYQTWRWREPSHPPRNSRQNTQSDKNQRYPHPPTRKSTIVDPKLFGPQNSLAGSVTRPVGFGEVDDLREDGRTPLEPPTVKQTGYFRSPVPSPRPVEIQDVENRRQTKEGERKRREPSPARSRTGELTQVFPMPTEDPGVFDITRGSVSTPSRIGETEKRPSFHARTDSLPLRQPKPMSPVRREVYDSPEKKIGKKDKNRSSSRSNDLALGGLAGAALTAAIAAGMSSPEIERYKGKERKDNGKGKTKAGYRDVEEAPIDSQRMFKDDMARRNGRRPEGVPDRRDSYGFPGAPISAVSPMSTREGKVDPFQYQVDKWEDEQSSRGTDYDPKGKKPMHERIAARAAGNGRDTGSSTPLRYQEDVARDRQREAEYQEQLYSSSPEVMRRGDEGVNRPLERTDSGRVMDARPRAVHERIASRAAESNPDTGRFSPTQKRLDDEAERRIAEVLAKWAPKRAADIAARRVELAQMDRMDEVDNLAVEEGIERGSTPAPEIKVVERRPKWADERDVSPMPPSRAPMDYCPEMTREKGKGRADSPGRWQPESPDLMRVKGEVGEGSNYAPPMVRTASDADHRYAQMNDDYFGSKPSASYSSKESKSKERRRGRSRTRSPSEEERGRGRTRSRSAVRARSPSREPEIREARSPLNKSARDGSPVDVYDAKFDRDRRFTDKDAEDLYEEERHFTAPLPAAAIGAAIAAVHRDEDRHRGDDHSHHDGQGKEVPCDKVQEEADRYYREMELARKLAKQHNNDPTPRVVTPPAMENHHESPNKEAEIYGVPDADFKFDHEMTPDELPLFSPVALRKSFSLPENFDDTKPFDPRIIGLARPILNIVRPTPTPEKQAAVPKLREPRSRSQSREDRREASRSVPHDDDKPSYSKPCTPSDVEDEPSNTFQEIPTITEPSQDKDDKDEKSVSWGTDDIQHYVPITPYDEPRNPHDSSSSIPSSPETTRAAPSSSGLPHSRSHERRKSEDSDIEDEKEKRDKGKGKDKGKAKEIKEETPEKRPKPKSLWSKFTPDLASQILQREELAYNLANASTIGFADGDEGREVPRDEVEELAFARGTLFKDPELENGEAFEYRGIVVEPEPPRKHRSKKHRTRRDVVVDQDNEQQDRGRDHRDRTVSPPPVGPKPSTSDVGGARMPGAFSDDEVAFARPRGMSPPASDVSTVIYHQPSELSDSAGIATGFNTAVHSMIGGDNESSLPLDLPRGLSDESFVDVDRPAGSSNESFVVVEEDKVPDVVKEDETMIVTVETPHHQSESFAVVDHASCVPNEETQPLIADTKPSLERSMTEDTEGFVTPLETEGAEVMSPFDASIEDISAPQILEAAPLEGSLQNVDTSFVPESEKTSSEITDALAQDASMMPLPESSKETVTETEASSSLKSKKKKKKGKKGAVSDTATESASTPLDLEEKVSEKHEDIPFGDTSMSEGTKHECRIAEVLLSDAVPEPESSIFPSAKEVAEETGHPEEGSKEIIIDLATPAVEDRSKEIATGSSDTQEKNLEGEIPSSAVPSQSAEVIASEITEPNNSARTDDDSITTTRDTAHEGPVADARTSRTRELGDTSSGLAPLDTITDPLQAGEAIDVGKDEKAENKSGINSGLAAVALAGTVAVVAGIANKMLGSKGEDRKEEPKEVDDVKERREFVEEDMPSGLNAKQRRAWKKKQDQAREAWTSAQASAEQSGSQTPAVQDAPVEVVSTPTAVQEDINKEIDNTPLQDAIEVVEPTPEAITDRGEAAEYYNPIKETSDVPVETPREVVDTHGTEKALDQAKEVVAEDIPATSETLTSDATTIIVDAPAPTPEAGVDNPEDTVKTIHENVEASAPVEMVFDKGFNMQVPAGLNKKQKREWVKAKKAQDMETETKRFLENVEGTEGYISPENPRPIGEEGLSLFRPVEIGVSGAEKADEQAPYPAPSTEDPTTIVVEASEPKPEAGVENLEEGVKAVHDNVEATETPLPVSADISTEASGTDNQTEEEMPEGLNKKQKKVWEKKQKEIKMQRELDAAAAEAVKADAPAEVVGESSKEILHESAAEPIIVEEARKDIVEPTPEVVSEPPVVVEESKGITEPVSEEPATIVVEAAEPQPETGIATLDDAVQAIHDNVDSTPISFSESAETAGQSSSDVQTEEEMPKGLNKKQKKAWQKKQEEARMQRDLDSAAAEAAKVESEATIAPVEIVEEQSKDISEPTPEIVSEPAVVGEVSKELVEPVSEPIIVEESKDITEPVPEEPATIVVEAPSPAPEAGVDNFDDAVRDIHDATATPPAEVGETPIVASGSAVQPSSDFTTEEEMPKGLNKKQKKAWQKKREEARIQRELDAAAGQADQTEAEATIAPSEVVEELSKDIVEPATETDYEPVVVEVLSTEVVEPISEVVFEPSVVEEQNRDITEPISKPVIVDQPAPVIIETPVEISIEAVDSPAVISDEPPKKMNKREKKAWDKAQREAKALAEAEAQSTAAVPEPSPAFEVPEVLPTPVFEDESGAFATAPMATPIPTPLEEPAQADTPPEEEATVSLSMEEAAALAASDPEAASGDVSLSIEEAAALAGDLPSRKLSKKEKKALEKSQRAKELEMESSTTTEIEGRVAVPTDAFKDIQDVQQNPDAGKVVEDQWGTSALATPMEVRSMITPDVAKPLETPAEDTEVSLGGKKKKKKKGKGKVVETEPEPMTPLAEPDVVQTFIEPATETTRDIDPVPETVIDPVAETLALLGGISRSRATPADIHQSVESAEQQIESPTDDDDAFHSAAEDRGRSETPTGTIGTIDDDEFKDFHSTNGDDFQSPANGHHAMPEIVESVPHIAEDVKEPEVATEGDFAPVGGKKKKKKKKGKGASGGDSGSGDVSGTVTPGGETEKESFLANAGTLGAGAGSATVLEESKDINSGIGANADAAGRWESQPSDVMMMVGKDKIGEEEREGTVVGHDDGKDVLADVTFERRREEDPVEETIKLLEGIDYQPKLGDILNDPEIREREVLPSVDPQFGDLLPLPPRESPPNEEVDGGALATQLPLTPVIETHVQFEPMMLGGIQEQNEPSETKEEVFTIDPEIQERKIHPSVDPQYGDLLPLPPSQPGSPARSLEEEILTTQLPDSPPESPAVARLSLDSSSPQTPKKKDTTHLMRSPSISAVPLKFLLGNRSTPSSPVAGKGSPVLTSPTRSELTERPKSRHSWDSSKGLQPLQLLERRHSRGSSLAEFDSRALAPLLEGAKPQHDKSPERDANDAALTDEGEISTPAEAFATAVSEKQGQDEYFSAPAEVAIESAPITIQFSSADIADTATQAQDDPAVLQPLSETPLETSTESATESATFVEEEMPKGLNAKARKAWKAKQKKAKEIFEAEQLANKTATVETETEPETVVSTLPADAPSVLETDSGEQSTSEAIVVEEPQPCIEDGVAQPAIIKPLGEIPAESEAIVDILEPSIARNISRQDSALGTPLESSTESPFVEEEMPQGFNAKARKAWKKKQDQAREAFEAEQAQNIATAETETNSEVARSDIVETPLEAPTQEVVGKSIGENDTPVEVLETTIVADDTPLDAPTAMIADESANITVSFEPSVARNITLPESGTATPLESSTEPPFVEDEMPTGLNAKQRKAWKKKQEKAKADWDSGLASTSAAESGLDTPAVQDTDQILSEPIVEAPIAEETPAPIENVVEPIAVSEPLEVSSDIDAEIVPEPAAIDEPQAALEDVAKDTPLPDAPLNAPSAVTETAVFVEEEMPAGLNAKARKAWKKKQDKAREEFESTSAGTSGGWTDSGAQTPAVVAPTSEMVQESGETPVIEPTQTPEAVAPAADTPSSGTISDFDAAVRALHDKASEPIDLIEAPAPIGAPLDTPAQPEATVVPEDTQAEAPALETPFEMPASITEPAPFVEEEMPMGLNAKQRKAWKKEQQKAKDDWESGLTSISGGESGVHTPAVVEASTEPDTLAPVVEDSQEASRDVELSAPLEQSELPTVEIDELPIISEQPPSATTDLESVLQRISAVEMIPEPSALDTTSAQAVVEPAAIEDVTAETPLRSEPLEDMMVQETPKLEIGGFIQTPAVEIAEPNLPQQPLFVEEEMPSGLNAKARKAWKKKQDKVRADFESTSASASASTGESGFQTPAAQDIQSEVVGESLKVVTEPSAVGDAPVIEETRELSQSVPALGDIAPESQPAEIPAEVPSEVAEVTDEPMPAVENIQPVATLGYVEEEMPMGLNAKQRKAWKKKQEKAKADWESGLTSTSAGESGLQTPAFEEAPAVVVDEAAKVIDDSESAPSAIDFLSDVLVDGQPIPVAVPAASTIDTTIYDVSDPAEQPTMVQPETIAVPQSVEQTPAAVMPPYEGGGLAAEYFEGMGTPPGPLSPSIRAAALSRDVAAEQPVETIVPIEESTCIDESKKPKKGKKKSLIVNEEQVSESQGEKGDVDSSAFETTSTKKAKKKKGKGKEIAVKQATAEVLSSVEEKKASEADDMDEDVAPKEIAPPTMLPGKVEDAFSRPQSPVATTDGAVDSAKDKKKKKKKGKKGVIEDAETSVVIEPSLVSVAIPADPEPEAPFQDEADKIPPDVFTELEAAQDIKQPVPAVAPIESDANDSPPTPDAVRETLALLGGISHTREPIVKISAQPGLPSEMAEETATIEQPAPVIERLPTAEVPEALREFVAEPSPVEETQPILDNAPTTDAPASITEPTTEPKISQDIPPTETPMESSLGFALEFVDEEMPKGLNAKARKAWKAKQKKAKEIFEAEQLVSKSATVETETEAEVVEQETKTENVLETPSYQTDAPVDVAKEVETIEQPSSIVEEVVSEVPISEPLQVVPPEPQAPIDDLEPSIATNISLPDSSGYATPVKLVEETAKNIVLADPPSEQHVQVPTGIVAAPMERHVVKEVTPPETPLKTSTESTAKQPATFVEEEMPKGFNAKKRKEWKKKQDKAREAFEAEQAEMRTATVETETEPEAVKQEMKTESVLETPSDQTDLPTEVSKEKEIEITTLEQPQSIDEDVITESATAPPLAKIPAQPDAIIDALEPLIARNIALPDPSGTTTPIESTGAETDTGGKKKKKKGRKALLPWEDKPTSTPPGEMTADELQAKMDAEKAAQSETVVEEIPAQSEPVAGIPVLEPVEIVEPTPETETSREPPFEQIIEEVPLPISDETIEIPLPESALATPLETTEAESSSALESASSQKSKKKKKKKGEEAAILWEEDPVSPAPEGAIEASEVVEEVIEPMSKDVAAQVAQPRVVVQAVEPADEDYVNRPPTDTVWIEDKEKDGESEQMETIGDTVMEEVASEPLRGEDVAKDIPLPETPMETATVSSGLDSGLSRKASKKKKKGKKNPVLWEEEPASSAPGSPVPEVADETPKNIEIVDTPAEQHIEVPSDEYVTISEPVLHETVVEVEHPSTPPNAEHVDVAVDIAEQPSAPIEPIEQNISGTASGANTPFVSVSINEDSDRTSSDKTPEEPIENTEQPKTAFLEHSASGKGSISQQLERGAPVFETTGAGGVGNFGEAETVVEAEQRLSSESGDGEQGKGKGEMGGGLLAGEEEVMPKGLNKKQKQSWEKAAEKRRVERQLAKADELALAAAAEKEVEEIVEQPILESMEEPIESEIVAEKSVDELAIETPVPEPILETPLESEVVDEWAPAKKLTKKQQKALEKAQREAEVQANADSAGPAPIVEPKIIEEPIVERAVEETPLESIAVESDVQKAAIETAVPETPLESETQPETPLDFQFEEEEMPKGLNKKQKKAWEKAAEKRRAERELAAEDEKRLAKAAEKEAEQIVEEPIVERTELEREVVLEEETPKMERELSKKAQKAADKKRREEEEQAEYEAKQREHYIADEEAPAPTTPAEQTSREVVEKPPMEETKTEEETAIEDEWAPTKKLSKKEKKALDKKHKDADEQALLIAATAAVTTGAALSAAEILSKDEAASKSRIVEESSPRTPVEERILIEMPAIDESVKDTPLQVTSRDIMKEPSTEFRTDSDSPPANTKAKRRDEGKGKAVETEDPATDKRSVFTPIETTRDIDEQDRSFRVGNGTPITAIFHARSSSPPSGSGIFQQALEKVVKKQVQQRDLQENITKEAVEGSWSFSSLADEDKPDTSWSASRLPSVLEEDASEQPRTPTSPTRERSPIHRSMPQDDSGYVQADNSPKPRPRSWFDPEYVRDSGVQLREKRSSDSQRSLKDLANTDDVLARRSWPPVDEERETVDLRRKKRSSCKESQSSPYEKITPGDIAKAATGLGIASGHKRSLSKSPALSESPSREFLLRKANRSQTPSSEEKGSSSSKSSRQPSALRGLERGETPRSASDRQHSRQSSLLESLHHERTDSPRSFSDQIHNPRTRTPRTPQEREDYYNRGATPTLSERGLGSSLSRPGSVISNRSVTPSLRRVSGRASTDLRALSQSDLKAQQSREPGAKEADSGSASDAKPSPAASNVNKRADNNSGTDISASGPPLPNEGRQRVKGMAEVYNGFGEGRMGSPRSPTRPHSMRRKQSMQLLDMQAQMAAMAEELAAARQEKAVILQAKEAAERNLDEARREASRAGQYKAQAEEVRGLLESMTLKNTDLTRQTLDLQAQLELRDNGAETAIAAAVAAAIASKEAEIQQLRARAERLSQDWSGDEREIEELEAIISSQKAEIATLRASQSTFAVAPGGAPDYLADFHKNDAYFEQSCQRLFRGVWRWIHAFSDRRKHSPISLDHIKSLSDQRIYSWLKDAFAGNPSAYLADLDKRRLVLMSLTMSLFHHYVFGKHFFGLDATREEASKVLEMIVDDSDISDAEFRTWRATQFCLFSKSHSYTSQRNSEVLAVTQSVLHKLSSVLPQPSNSASDEQRTKILIGELQIIVKKAAELSNDMRRQRLKYIWQQSPKALWGAPRSKAPERFIAGSMTHAEICVQFMELHRVDEKLSDSSISAEVRATLNNERAMHLGTLVRDFHVIAEDEAMVPGFRLPWEEMLRRMEEKNRRIEEKGMGVRLTLFPMVIRERDASGEGKEMQIIWKAVVKPVDLKIPTPGGKRRTSDMGSVAGGSEHGSKHARVR